ncbi:hypothetical protein P170DRAFT_24990 [Aspergillus steynii IBT 23096]|uniref:Uncharacterized protein n=1 Tax=Aspergillus steynii IBT 23096 TaxID=1392250 RepID=A0A2I2GPK9_9EURO|nr:uncharacterized protein P170DRAFT_24990 [Aspergillus steynii IBT 23096]PLB54799.1 hypothetical protein P170DRAFT_24990 [Aspergillus steynii IBT 23096]
MGAKDESRRVIGVSDSTPSLGFLLVVLFWLWFSKVRDFYTRPSHCHPSLFPLSRLCWFVSALRRFASTLRYRTRIRYRKYPSWCRRAAFMHSCIEPPAHVLYGVCWNDRNYGSSLAFLSSWQACPPCHSSIHAASAENRRRNGCDGNIVHMGGWQGDRVYGCARSFCHSISWSVRM